MNKEILDKVQKLVNLSKSDNANEAATAWGMAQKLMTKHRISLLDLEEAQGVKEELQDVAMPGFFGSKIVAWKGYLANHIAKLNGCKLYFWKTNDNVVFKLIGRLSDIQIVNYLYNSIVQQIEILSARALKIHGGGKTFTNNFKWGAAQTVVDRLQKAQEELKSEVGCFALVRLDNRYVEAEQESAKLKLRKHSFSLSSYDKSGRELGIQAGKNVSLNKGLTESHAVKSLV